VPGTTLLILAPLYVVVFEIRYTRQKRYQLLFYNFFKKKLPWSEENYIFKVGDFKFSKYFLKGLIMKRLVQILMLMGFVLSISACVTGMSAENKVFQQEAGIDLTFVKRGLYSVNYGYRNSMIEQYYRSLLNNALVFVLDDSRDEFAQQKFADDTLSITINGQFQDYTYFEKAVLLVASTSALALLHDPSFNKNEISNMFFNIIRDYDATYDNRMPNIANAEWFKNRNLMITDDSILIGAKREPIQLGMNSE
jgi:hypothetical protein